MNSGESVDDGSRTGLDEASGPGAPAGHDGHAPARSPITHKPLQDIQDIIDKLAVVTQQLRHPHGGVASRSN
jgi:hypothetical protein